jgi:hypothetical protein
MNIMAKPSKEVFHVPCELEKENVKNLKISNSPLR